MATGDTEKPKEGGLVTRKLRKQGNDQYEVEEEGTMIGNFPYQPERHECDRVCKKGEPQKVCMYRLDITAHTTMGKVKYMSYIFY